MKKGALLLSTALALGVAACDKQEVEQTKPKPTPAKSTFEEKFAKSCAKECLDRIRIVLNAVISKSELKKLPITSHGIIRAARKCEMKCQDSRRKRPTLSTIDE